MLETCHLEVGRTEYMLKFPFWFEIPAPGRVVLVRKYEEIHTLGISIYKGHFYALYMCHVIGISQI